MLCFTYPLPEAVIQTDHTVISLFSRVFCFCALAILVTLSFLIFRETESIEAKIQ